MFASNLKLRIPAARPGTRNLSKRIISIPRPISWDFSGLVNQRNTARLVFVSAHEFNQLEPMGAMRSEQRKSELDDPADSDETKTRNFRFDGQQTLCDGCGGSICRRIHQSVTDALGQTIICK